MELMAFVVTVPIPIPIPMTRFQCRGLQMTVCTLLQSNIYAENQTFRKNPFLSNTDIQTFLFWSVEYVQLNRMLLALLISQQVGT